MLIYVALVAALMFCAVMVMRAARLISAALWLAIVSLCVSLMLYALGAPQVAALELSIGAGLVTVLIVLAISIAGDDALSARPVVPRWTAFGLSAAAILAFIAAVLPPTAIDITQAPAQNPATSLTFSAALWQVRIPDMLLQVALMFVGLLTVLGLLADSHESAQGYAHSATHIPTLELDTMSDVTPAPLIEDETVQHAELEVV